MSGPGRTAEIGRVVFSAAGHDSGRFYAVVHWERGRAYIADGKARKLCKPKAKNPLHLRPTNHMLDINTITTDKQLARALAALGGQEPEIRRRKKEGGEKLVEN